MAIFVIPADRASSTPYCNIGLLIIGSISLGTAFVAGRKRVPNPAAGKRHLLIINFYKGFKTALISLINNLLAIIFIIKSIMD
jgi:hypothetical protein